MNQNFSQNEMNYVPQPQKPPIYQNWIFWVVIGGSVTMIVLGILVFLLFSQWFSLAKTGLEMADEQLDQVQEMVGESYFSNSESAESGNELQEELREELQEQFDENQSEAAEDSLDSEKLQDLMEKYDELFDD